MWTGRPRTVGRQPLGRGRLGLAEQFGHLGLDLGVEVGAQVLVVLGQPLDDLGAPRASAPPSAAPPLRPARRRARVVEVHLAELDVVLRGGGGDHGGPLGGRVGLALRLEQIGVRGGDPQLARVRDVQARRVRAVPELALEQQPGRRELAEVPPGAGLDEAELGRLLGVRAARPAPPRPDAARRRAGRGPARSRPGRRGSPDRRSSADRRGSPEPLRRSHRRGRRPRRPPRGRRPRGTHGHERPARGRAPAPGPRRRACPRRRGVRLPARRCAGRVRGVRCGLPGRGPGRRPTRAAAARRGGAGAGPCGRRRDDPPDDRCPAGGRRTACGPASSVGPTAAGLRGRGGHRRDGGPATADGRHVRTVTGGTAVLPLRPVHARNGPRPDDGRPHGRTLVLPLGTVATLGRSPDGRRSCHCGRSPWAVTGDAVLPLRTVATLRSGHRRDGGPATADGRRGRDGHRTGRRSCHCGRSPRSGRSPAGRRSCHDGRSPRWGRSPLRAIARSCHADRSRGAVTDGRGPATAAGHRGPDGPRPDDGPATTDAGHPGGGHPADGGPATAAGRRTLGAVTGRPSVLPRGVTAVGAVTGRTTVLPLRTVAAVGTVTRATVLPLRTIHRGRSPAGRSCHGGRSPRSGRSPDGRRSCHDGRSPVARDGPAPRDAGRAVGAATRGSTWLPARPVVTGETPAARGTASSAAGLLSTRRA